MNHLKWTWIGLMGAIGIVADVARAQDPPAPMDEVLRSFVADDEMATDRPDFTETSVAVQPRRFQVEAGLTFENDDAVDVFESPELLLRYGLLRRVEVRLGIPGYVRTNDDGAVESGTSEAYAGFKIQLGTPGSRYGVALIPAVTWPTDDEDSGDAAFELVGTWAYEMQGSWSIGGIVGHAWLETADRGPDATIATTSLAYDIGEKWGTFLEWAAEFSDEESGHLLHHGYTYLLVPRFQLDGHFGIGISDDAPDFFIGTGLGWKF